MSRQSSSIPRSAFTLVELLVVIAIIGILIGMLLPAVQQVRAAARWTSCRNNLRQMGLAVQSYNSTFEKYPPGCDLNTGSSWQAFILPYVEQQNIYDQINVFDDGAVDWKDAPFNALVSTDLDIFRCAADPVVNEIPSHGVFDARYPSSYLSVSSGTTPANDLTGLVGNSDVTYTRLEWTSGSPDLVQAIRSGVMTATQDATFDGSGNVVEPALVTQVRQDDIEDGLANTAIIGESVFDSTLMIGSSTIGVDHWCIASYSVDFRGGVDETNPGANSQDESEVMGATSVPLNYYHSSQSLTSASTLVGQQIAWSFGSWHPNNSSTFVMADGSVHVVTTLIDDLTYANLGHRADGQVPGEIR